MSSRESSMEPESSESVSVHTTELPEWQGDNVECEMCGDAGGAAHLILCENVDHGCVGGRHLYCFQPSRMEMPEEEKWHCAFCLEHGFDVTPYAPAGIGMDAAELASPVALEPEIPIDLKADSPRSAASSPTSREHGSRGSRDSVVAAEEALLRAAAAAAQADGAAPTEPEQQQERDSRKERAKAVAGKSVASVGAAAGGTAADQTAAAGVATACRAAGSASTAETGSRRPGESEPKRILPAKRKAEADAEAAPLHDGWAKLPKPLADAAAAAPPLAKPDSAAQPLPKLPPLRTGAAGGASGGGAGSNGSGRAGGGGGGGGPSRASAVAKSVTQRGGAGKAAAAAGGLRRSGSADSRDGRERVASESPRLQDDEALFGARTPRSAAAAKSAAASQPGRSKLAPQHQRPGQQPSDHNTSSAAQPPQQQRRPGEATGAKPSLQQQQQQQRPQQRPGKPGRPPPPGQPRPQAQQQGPQQQRPQGQRPPQPNGAPPAGQVSGADAGGGGAPGDKPADRRPRAPSGAEAFLNIMSGMQAPAKEYNSHEEDLKRAAEERKDQQKKQLDAERKQTAAARGPALWNGAMRLNTADDGRSSPSAAQPLHLVAFSLQGCKGADSAAAAGLLPTQFDARLVSIDEIDVDYADAHREAALLFGSNTADAAGVMRGGHLCRSLLQQRSAIRAELPSSKAWLALVPNPPDGGPALLWGYIVTTGDRPEPRHRQQQPPRSALKKTPSTDEAAKAPLRWTDGRHSTINARQSTLDDCTPGVERGPGPAYGNAQTPAAAAAAAAAAKAATAAAATQQPQQDLQPPSPTKGRQRPGGAVWRHNRQQPPQPPPPGQQEERLVRPEPPDAAQRPLRLPGAAVANGGAGGGAHPAAAVAVQPPATDAAPAENGLPRLPLRGFRFSLVGYQLLRDKNTVEQQTLDGVEQQALDGVRRLGAEHFRFPVTPGSVSALLLHPGICQNGFENNHVEFCAKDFLLKPPIQFFCGLDYIMQAARLKARPAPALAHPYELLPCGILVLTDAATMVADPDSLKKVFTQLKRGWAGCNRERGCSWAVCLSPLEHMRLEDANRRTRQKDVGQALQMFTSRLPGVGTGPALSRVLEDAEVSSKNTPSPPQLVRDAVKVAYKHMGDCRHVILASNDRALVSTGMSQSSILACEGLAQTLVLVTQIVDHLDVTCHRPGGLH